MKNLPTGVTIPTGGSSTWAKLTATTDDNVVVGAGNDEKLTPVTGSAFTLDNSGPFTLSVADGIVTYTGEEVVALVSAVVVLSPTGGLTGWSAAIISLNNDMSGQLLDGTNRAEQVSKGLCVSQQSPGAFGNDTLRKCVPLPTQRLCALTAGDTLRLLGANKLADDQLVLSLTMLVQALT